VLAAGLALTLGLAACSDGGGTDATPEAGSSSAAAGTSIKLGFMGDLTGPNSGIVIPPRNGAKLVIDEYNKTNPPVKVELVEYDSQGDGSKAVSLAQQAINNKIVGLIGPAFSGESAQVAPVLEEAMIPSISASATNAALATSGWKYWHRVLPSDSVQGPGIANFIADGVAAKNVFVIDDKSDYGKPLADVVRSTLEGKGVKLESDSLDPAESDFSSVVNKVAAAKPDAIFFGGYYAAGGILLKQLRDKGVKDAKFLSGDGSLDKGLIDGAGAANAEGALVGCPCYIATPDVTDAKVKAFADTYKATYSADPAIYAAEGYDAATVFIEAIKAGNVTAEKINAYLPTVDLAGVSKQIKFEANGEVAAKDIYIYQVKDGAIGMLGKATEAKLG
jgi:branched-chain amino acid transport system substrate-binding protein